VLGPNGSFSGIEFIALNIIKGITEFIAVRYVVYALYLTCDAILVTKTGAVTFAGLFILSFLKLTYKEGRPYWNHLDIKVYECLNDFEGPSDNMFILTFFYTYINLIFLRKYSRRSHKILSWFLFFIQFGVTVLVIFSGILFG
jgi:hypothetical protein